MISKQYFEKTFSLATAQALQAWANDNLIVHGQGDYAMRIDYAGVGEMFAETEVTGLTIGNEYTLSTITVDEVTNSYKTNINALPNDNTSMVAQLGWGTGQRSLLFTATAETMYVAIGDEVAASTIRAATYLVVDNISLKIGGAEAITNGTFEGSNTTGWYAQNANSALSVYSYAVAPTPPSDNPYLEQVNIPVYDSGNAEHFLIDTVGKFTDANLNNSAYKNFYMQPGDYRAAGQVTLTTSGTGSARRTISLHNGNDTHPASLGSGGVANYAFIISGASYWTIDRCVSFDVSYEYYLCRINANSTYNIINRMYTKETNNPFWIRKNANYNTIQSSMFDGKSFSAYDSELGGVIMQDWDSVTNIVGNKFINNDFINMNGIRLGDDPDRVSNFNNTIIDGNYNEYNSDIRCDCGAATSLNPSGHCIYTEGFLTVLKGGSNSESEPVIVSNNVTTGVRKSRTIGEIGYNGDAILMYQGVDNVEVYNNVTLDSTGGITTASDGGLGATNINVLDNVMMDSGDYTGNDTAANLRMYSSTNVTMERNLMVNPVGDYWAQIGSNVSGNVFSNNDIVNIGSSTLQESGSGYTAANNNSYATTVDAGYTEDFTYTKDRYTVTSQVITIPDIIKP